MDEIQKNHVWIQCGPEIYVACCEECGPCEIERDQAHSEMFCLKCKGDSFRLVRSKEAELYLFNKDRITRQ